MLSRSETRLRRPTTFFNFLNLPKEIRFNIYREALANQTHRTCFLFQDSGSRVECFAPGQPKLRLDLLYVNKKIHDEAVVVLYGSNCFNVVDTTERQSSLLKAFFDRIGSANAAMLTYLCISFPADKGTGCLSGEALFREEHLLSLKLLEERCAKLTTLELFVHSNNSSVLIDGKDHEPQYRRAGLMQIEGLLKRIFSLNKIVIRLYSGVLDHTASELMESFGWVVLRGDERWR